MCRYRLLTGYGALQNRIQTKKLSSPIVGYRSGGYFRLNGDLTIRAHIAADT